MYKETQTIDLNNPKVKKVTENNFEKIKSYILKICQELKRNNVNIKTSDLLKIHDDSIKEQTNLLNKYIKSLTSYELYDLKILAHIEYSVNQMICSPFKRDKIDIGDVNEIFKILMKMIQILPNHQKSINQKTTDFIKSMSKEISHQSIQMSFKAAFLIEPNLSRLENIRKITIPNIYTEVIEILKYHDKNIKIDAIYEGHLKLGKFKRSNKDEHIIHIYPKENDISNIIGIEQRSRTDCYIGTNIMTYSTDESSLSSRIEILIGLQHAAKQEKQYYARHALKNTQETIEFQKPIEEPMPDICRHAFAQRDIDRRITAPKTKII